MRDDRGDLVPAATRAHAQALEHFLYDQAVFYGEVLVAEAPTEEHHYLLGLALFHAKEVALQTPLYEKIYVYVHV